MVVSGCSRSGMVEGVATDEGGSRGGGRGVGGGFDTKLTERMRLRCVIRVVEREKVLVKASSLSGSE